MNPAVPITTPALSLIVLLHCSLQSGMLLDVYKFFPVASRYGSDPVRSFPDSLLCTTPVSSSGRRLSEVLRSFCNIEIVQSY